MTKERAPLSIENALRRVLGQLELERAAELTGRSESYLHALTDPDRRECLAVPDLEALDLAHHEQFGTGFPLFETLGRRLGTARAERFADLAAIGGHARGIAKEHAEALDAMLAASLSGRPDARALSRTLQELEDLARAVTDGMTTVRCAIAHLSAAPELPP